MEVLNMVLGEEDSNGGRNVTEDKDSLHTVDCNMVVMALGTIPNHEALKQSDISLNGRGLIVLKTKTSLENVYAGGYLVTDGANVILAMEVGKKDAHEIIESLS